MKKIFVGRSRELEVLDHLWESPQATLLILYGRRRVGKTRLLTHWLGRHTDAGLYWVAEPASALTQLRAFSQAIMAFMDPEGEIPPDFTFSTWEMAFRQLALYSQNRKIALFIDEVTYLIDVNPDFVGMLQKVWDRWLTDADLMLALSGSQMGLVQKHLLAYDAPLHGRATAQMQLPPLPYGTTQDYFPEYNAKERVTLYAMWGGIPAYWERINPQLPIIENLRRNILPAHAWMVDESRILLQDFINDLHNYVGIMRAIAEGQQAISDISDRTGLTSSKASFYLSVLRDTGFVMRDIPISQRGTDSRRGRYFVTDPYLRFFYRFLSAYQSKLALGQHQAILDQIQEGLENFIQANTWQELCQIWLLMASAQGEIPLPIAEVGSEWAKKYVVDVVGVEDNSKTLVLGDCYWQSEPLTVAAIEELIDKTNHIVPSRQGKWEVYYLVFSAHGWTSEVEAQAKAIALAGQKRRWQVAGIRLINLDQLDQDLIRWSV
ncbi:MAG TPA: ATP-binding protein [Anaerolineae bacterium]|nr:ATP-binding protein [Anaerolineae bacterium]